MAGDWIKIERATFRKPEVLLAAELLGMKRREALGLFLEYFGWLDENLGESSNGHVDACVTLVSRSSVDEALQCPGFAAVLERIGWAKFDDNTRALYVVNASRHNGKSAKSRALRNERQRRFRNAHVDAHVDAAALPEKRREEKSIKVQKKERGVVAAARPPSGMNGAHRGTRLTEDWRLPEDWRDFACTVYHIDPSKAVLVGLKFRDWHLAAPGDKGVRRDWKAAWRNWLTKEFPNA